MRALRFLVVRLLAVGFVLAMPLAGPAVAQQRFYAVTPVEPEAAPQLALVPVATGLTAPLFAGHAGDGSGRLFIVERQGRIRILDRGTLRARPFLDIGARVLDFGEQGLLGLAFHPRYASNGRFFVAYSRRSDAATVIAEYRVSARDPNLAVNAERVLLTVPQPFANHKSGMLAFGPDGDLYIGVGDGGGDPALRAQNRSLLLGKILRIDVDGARPYAIPPDNPFANGGGRREIYALGLRNPWRFSFDRGTGRLYAGDVGETRFEEIDLIQRGGNFGWPIVEGNACFTPATGCNTTGLRTPLVAYRHVGGRCAITGGYVYRGRAIPALVGSYVYGDFCTGEIFGMRAGQLTPLLDTALSISSFGEDQAGELYVVSITGTVSRLVARGS